ncbi:MAG: FAD-dependent oxidoreductase, partial [Bacilli bacterium]
KGIENIQTLWSYEDAVNLKHHIHDMFRKAKYEQDSVIRKKLLKFIVVGSGFTGVEMAGELAEYRKELCFTYDIDPSEVMIDMIEAGDKILPFYPEKLRNKVSKRLEKMGVNILLGKAVCDVEKTYCKFDESSILDTHTVIWAAGIQGSDLVQLTEDVNKTPNGRIKTNKYLQTENNEDVYVIGDNIFYVPEGEENPVPQMVENAEHSSHTVSHNIIADITGKEKEEYRPIFSGSMVCVGGRWGVAHVGRKKKYALSGIPAMFVKHFVNVIYFMNVLGLHKVWHYGVKEIFTVKNNRSLFGGHFSNAKSAPGFFLLPLRLLIGFLWLASGITKLPSILNDWRNVFLMPSNPIDAASAATEVSEAADAASTATGTVESAETVAEVAQELTGFEEFANNLKGFTELGTESSLPVPEFIQNIMNWNYENFFWAESGGFTTFAAIVQSSMIFLEIIVGIMFLLGLFTPIAAILSFILMIIIYLSGWSNIGIVVFGFASLACFFAGNVFGLDYYLLPKVDKLLRKFKFTRKWYLYFKHE